MTYRCRLCGSAGDETCGLPFFHMVTCTKKGCPNEKTRTFHVQWQQANVPRGPLHQFFKQRYPWWAKDDMGWPIEHATNRPTWLYWLRVLFQNIRKVTG
jgi:hypothetical protein